MAIQVACPSCGRQLKVPDNLLGKMVKCPGCEQAFQASTEPTAAPPPLPPEEAPRRSDRDDQYQEDAPRPRRRDRDDDDDRDDDRPRRRRRSREDYAPHRGTLILVLGILGLVGCGLFTAIPAWIMGSNDLREIRAGRMDPEGEQLTNIGKILGMISCILTVCLLALYCVIFVIIGAAGMGGAAGRR